MSLSQLGFDEWSASVGLVEGSAEGALARVIAVDRDRYVVRGASGECSAGLTGRFRHTAESPFEFPCVGDWVSLDEPGGDVAVIREVLPRRSFLRRRMAGRNVDYQPIAANVDAAFLVQSCHFDFNLQRLERYLVMAREGGVEPIIVLSKIDLVTDGELDALLASIRGRGLAEPVLPLSVLTGVGLEAFHARLSRHGTYCLLGSSGVGKSTLINSLVSARTLETAAVSATGEGRHTTVRRELIVTDDGALLIDTPGMRELGMLGAEAGIAGGYDDIESLARACRFGDCRHSAEPGCAVRQAIEKGVLDEARFENFLKLRKESEFHEMSYVERRQREKAFGRLVQSTARPKRR